MTLAEVAQLVQIIVGVGVIFSIYFSYKALKKSDLLTIGTVTPFYILYFKPMLKRGLEEKGTVPEK